MISHDLSCNNSLFMLLRSWLPHRFVVIYGHLAPCSFEPIPFLWSAGQALHMFDIEATSMEKEVRGYLVELKYHFRQNLYSISKDKLIQTMQVSICINKRKNSKTYPLYQTYRPMYRLKLGFKKWDNIRNILVNPGHQTLFTETKMSSFWRNFHQNEDISVSVFAQ